jgi:hypothetical protein
MFFAQIRSAIWTLLNALFWLILAVFISLLLVSCGGGGSSRVADGGIEGTGISLGGITDFGSIFVNGVEFDTNAASITLGGNPVNEADLKLGMVVEVQGSISGDNGTANTVVAEDTVKGPVTSVTADQLVVLGQTVQINELTNFGNNVVPGVNDLVEVYGLIKGNGQIGGTFVEVKTALTEFRVKGFVENTKPVTKTFTIGLLKVDYSAADTGDLAGGNPVDGQLVEVKGQNTLGAGGELLATKVEPEGLAVAAADRAEVEGFVTNTTATPTFDFVVGNQPVLMTGSTIFAGGLQIEIVVGLKVEVEGTLAGGILTATKVSFRDSVKLESDVEMVNAGAGTLTLKGLPGITVQVNGQTEFENVSDLGGIAVDDHVSIRGRPTSGNTVIASEVEAHSPDTRVVLQGAVDAFSVPPNDSVTILGVMVDTTGIADANFEGIDDMPTGRAAFFDPVDGVAVGDLVKVQGDLAGSTVNWDEIEFED